MMPRALNHLLLRYTLVLDCFNSVGIKIYFLLKLALTLMMELLMYWPRGGDSMGKMSGVTGGGRDNQTQNNNLHITTRPKTIICNSQNNRKIEREYCDLC